MADGSLVYGSVCSGIEAATAAWHVLGWRPAFFSEIEPFPRAVLAHHYGCGSANGVPLHGDFTTIQAGDYEPIDLLVGGTPCQSFSIAGLRGGLGDDRGNLALEFLCLADRLRPTWIVWENVPGVLSSLSHDAPDPRPPEDPMDLECDGAEMDVEDEYDSEELHAFNCFLAGLSELGYGFAYRVLDAQYFGLAQRRERVFVVGYLGDWRRAASVLFEQHSLSGNPAPSRSARKDVAPTLSARTKGGGGLGTDFDLDGGLIDAGTIAPPLTHNPYGDHESREGLLVAATLDASYGRLRGCSGQDANHGHSHLIATPILEAGARTGKSTDDIRAGIGIGDPGDPMFTLQSGKQHAVAYGGNNTTGPIDISTALNSHGRIDFESETFIAHSLRAEGFDASEDGTGRGTPIIPVAFDTTQITSKANRSNPKAGDPRHPLAAGAHAPAIAFSCKDHGADTTDDLAPTMRAMGHDGSHANVGGQLAIAQTLTADILRKGGASGGKTPGPINPIYAGSSVRRLMPIECERLMEFSDGYTDVPFRGKGAADGPRYKALGNSMAVPVIRWIGERIQLVEALTRPANSNSQTYAESAE